VYRAWRYPLVITQVQRFNGSALGFLLNPEPGGSGFQPRYNRGKTPLPQKREINFIASYGYSTWMIKYQEITATSNSNRMRGIQRTHAKFLWT
jgi:hypothetical protein